jgi:hypothetical protein
MGGEGRSMTEEERFFSTAVLTNREWRAVVELSNAYGDFEPLAARNRIGPITAAGLVRKGLAETGRTAPRFDRSTFPIGYRLTTLGWKIMKRGRKP